MTGGIGAMEEVGIGMLGAGFIGQMHSLSFTTARYAMTTPAVQARLVALAERDEGQSLAQEVQRRYGWEEVYLDDWSPVVGHDGVDLFINSGPNDAHLEPTIAAMRNGKHVFCEKPLARTADEAYRLWQESAEAGVIHMCAYLHRFIPSLRLARQMIRAGEIGDVLHFRSNFLLDMREPDRSLTWRFSQSVAGGGAVGDLGSHHIDQARYLVGEVRRVAAMTTTWSEDTAGRIRDVNDDAFSAIAELDNGATATFEGSRVPGGHTLTGRIEVDGTKGTLAFSMERLNELTVTQGRTGPRTILVAGGNDPFGRFWLPVGIQGAHPAGWRDCFAYQAHHMLSAVQHGTHIGPEGATFEDGYKVAEIVDTILRSAQSGRFEEVTYLPAPG